MHGHSTRTKVADLLHLHPKSGGEQISFKGHVDNTKGHNDINISGTEQIGLDCDELDCIGLNWTVLGWIVLDWVGVNWLPESSQGSQRLAEGS